MAKGKCRKGHEMSPDNVRIKGGYRYCRACSRKYQRDWARRNKNKGVVSVEPEVTALTMRDIPNVESRFQAMRGVYQAAIRRLKLLGPYMAVKIEFPGGTVFPCAGSVAVAAKSLGVRVGQRVDGSAVYVWLVKSGKREAA